MNLFSKVSSILLLGGLAVSSLATVSTFATADTSTSTTTSQKSEVKDARGKLAATRKAAKTKVAEVKKEAKEEIKTAKKAVKVAKINHRLQKAETAYNTLIKRADAKSLDTTKIKANIEILKTAELKLKTDLDSNAAKDVITSDRTAIKTALTAVKADAKDLRTQLAKK